MQTDTIALKQAVEKAASIIQVVTLIFPVLILGFGFEGAKLFYTNTWLAGVPSLYWFAASTFCGGIMVALGQGILVLGKSKDIFIATSIANVCNIILALLFVFFFGYIGIAIASCLTVVILFFLYLHVAKKIGIAITLEKVLFPKLFVSATTLLVIVLLNNFFPTHFIFFLIKVTLAVLCYCGLMFWFSRNDIVAILVILFGFFKMNTMADAAKKLAITI